MSTEETAQIALNHLGQISRHAEQECKCVTPGACRRQLAGSIRYAQRVLTRIKFGTLK